jgi:hypothetical protein
MRGWKWVVFMWSSIAGIVIASSPSILRYLATPDGARMIIGFSSFPILIWMLFWLKGIYGTKGKDPKKWWKEDDEVKF